MTTLELYKTDSTESVKKDTEKSPISKKLDLLEKEISTCRDLIGEQLGATLKAFSEFAKQNPDFGKEIQELTKYFENNRQNITREFVSEFLWKVIGLLENHKNIFPESISKNFIKAQQKMQEVHGKLEKYAPLMAVLGKNKEKMLNYKELFPKVIKDRLPPMNNNTSKTTTPNTHNHLGLSVRPTDLAA